MLEAGTLDLALVQGEVAHEAWAGIGRSPAALRIVAAMYSTAGMFVVRADSKATAHPGPGRAARRLRRAGLGARHPRPLRPRRPRPRPRPGLQGGLPRARGRRTRDGARRACRRALGRRARLARLRRGGEGARRRALHRARPRRHPPHPGHASVPQAADGAGQLVSRPGHRPRLGRLVELHPRAPDLARRRRVPRDPRAAPGRVRPRRAAAPGARDDRRQHRPWRRRAPTVSTRARAATSREIGLLRSP